jgi:hypothetical protein
MALTKVSTGVVDMSQDTGGLVIAKGTTTQQPTCDASILLPLVGSFLKKLEQLSYL